MSFSLTEAALIEGRKTVTRRTGWRTLKPGDRVRAVRKCMGLKPGEKVEPLGTATVVSVRREPLDAITREDVAREGFADMLPEEFVTMFVRAMGCAPSTEVTRIEFTFEPRSES